LGQTRVPLMAFYIDYSRPAARELDGSTSRVRRCIRRRHQM